MFVLLLNLLKPTLQQKVNNFFFLFFFFSFFLFFFFSFFFVFFFFFSFFLFLFFLSPNFFFFSLYLKNKRSPTSSIGLRVLYRPSAQELPLLYKTYTTEYAQHILPGI